MVEIERVRRRERKGKDCVCVFQCKWVLWGFYLLVVWVLS